MPYFILLKKRDYARLRHYIRKCVYMNTWELTVYHKRENRCWGERWMNRLDLPSSSWTMQIDQNHRIVCKDTKIFIKKVKELFNAAMIWFRTLFGECVTSGPVYIIRRRAIPWKPRLTWKSILVFEPTGGGWFSNLNISKAVGDINKLFSNYENLVFWASSGLGFMSLSQSV